MKSKSISALKLRHIRLRKRVVGTSERPRLSVHFSGQHIYAQVINDSLGVTIASVSTTEKALRAGGLVGANAGSAAEVGRLMAERAKAREVSTVVFDRGGFRFHGKVRALAEAARAGGLNF